MSTTRTESRRRGRTQARTQALVALVGVLALMLTGCRGDVVPTGGDPGAVGISDPDPDARAGLAAALAAPHVIPGLQRNLDRRAATILSGDVSGFEAGLATKDPAFLAQQEQYYANLRQLPLQVVSFAPVAASLVRRGSSYVVNVQVTLQLQGYDAVPVTSVDRYSFRGLPKGRAFRLASVTDADWETRNKVQEQPWDAGPIQVRSGAGVLGIFDPRSVRYAASLLGSVERGISSVSAIVPYPWTRTVVVYALSDDRFLSSIPELPGGDPQELDAVAYPVLADTEEADAELAGTRMVLSPRMLTRMGPGRDRLVRHELTHAAIGTHDDDAPVWLGEGLAEFVSVQAEAPTDRKISEAALAAARRGFSGLPPDATFNDDSAAAHYGLAWWACEYVVAVAGQPALWSLLDQLEGGAQQDDVLQSVAGVNARTLARKAGKLLLATFEPPPPVTPVVPGPVAPGPVVPSASPGIS